MTPARTVTKQDVLEAARKRWPDAELFERSQSRTKWCLWMPSPHSKKPRNRVGVLAESDTLAELLRKVEAAE